MANGKIYKILPHIFALTHRVSEILTFKNVHIKNRSWSWSTIFAMTPFKGKCQILQLTSTHFCASLNSFRDINPLAGEFFFQPFAGHRVNFLQIFTWHGLSLLMFTVWHGLPSLVLMFSGLRIEAPPHPQYRVSVYTLFKAETSRFNFCSYVLNLVKINISFFLSKAGSPGANLSAARA